MRLVCLYTVERQCSQLLQYGLCMTALSQVVPFTETAVVDSSRKEPLGMSEERTLDGAWPIALSVVVGPSCWDIGWPPQRPPSSSSLDQNSLSPPQHYCTVGCGAIRPSDVGLHALHAALAGKA
mmetsp:Transcript_128180/g.221417  ORF Transcript_128180/g.221417 Transcript_128180/m.221417 type:complete len:124 (-) Transcript_128180:192-563(-)